MADELKDEMRAAPDFDDARLLAFALGLDDDPELVAAAAAADDGLRRRLDAMHADVARVGAQVRAAVPCPAANYADPSDPRWAGLQELFAPPPAKTRSRASRWLRVLAPAAVALVAVAVGLAVINDQKSGTARVDSSLPTAAKATATAAGPLTGAGAAATDRAEDNAQALRDQLDQYAVVVLAKAKAVSGAFQRFVVVKVLKGAGPESVRLRVADRPADAGRLELLLMHPQLGGSAQISPEPTPVPSAAETASTLADLAVGVPVTYLYHGETAVLRELPAGTDPDVVRLP